MYDYFIFIRVFFGDVTDEISDQIYNHDIYRIILTQMVLSSGTFTYFGV